MDHFKFTNIPIVKSTSHTSLIFHSHSAGVNYRGSNGKAEKISHLKWLTIINYWNSFFVVPRKPTTFVQKVNLVCDGNAHDYDDQIPKMGCNLEPTQKC